MRGLMTSLSGRLIERPITASLREGLPSWDYFVSAYGGRKGLTDKGVRTADAGYLTRKLVAAAQAVVVTLPDCGTLRGIVKRVPLGSMARALGRVSLEEVCEGGRVVVRAGELIGPEQARLLAETGRQELRVRSPISCQARRGVCQKCYGTDLATGKLVEVGTAVGIVAAQSIGEPGTQLTLRTFHGGGVAGRDIVNDLDRVNRLLEVSAPTDAALLAPASGTVHVRRCAPGEPGSGCRGWWLDPWQEGEAEVLPRWRGKPLRVGDGDTVEAGDELTEGGLDARRLLRLTDPARVAERLLKEVRMVYRAHGLEIDDRHFEVILARMLGFVQVLTPGDTPLVRGQVVERGAFDATNAALAEGRLRATCRPCLVGIRKVAAAGAGFLAAASFQGAVGVLTGAALAGRVDRLEGLMENVILGRRVPAGTGMPGHPERGKDEEQRRRGLTQ
jgi:DNA-directed RNA polymerase subunit beta'